MKSRIISVSLAAVLAVLLPQLAKAQIAASNPLEWVALAEGNELINSQIDKQIKGQTQTAVLQNSIARIFLTLGKLGKAIKDNPQGIIAGMSMNNLYIETATELVSVFSLLNDAVAKGGKENMLTGAERSQTLWALNDKLSAFSRKLHLLYLSIRYYTLNDVWNNVTAGMIDRSNGEVAQLALNRWRRAAALAR